MWQPFIGGCLFSYISVASILSSRFSYLDSELRLQGHLHTSNENRTKNKTTIALSALKDSYRDLFIQGWNLAVLRILQGGRWF